MRLADLPLDEVLTIKGLRDVKTKRGVRFVIDLPDKKCLFVPDETNSWLLTNPKQVKAMLLLINEEKIGFRHIASGGLEFVNLEEEQAEKKAPEDDATAEQDWEGAGHMYVDESGLVDQDTVQSADAEKEEVVETEESEDQVEKENEEEDPIEVFEGNIQVSQQPPEKKRKMSK